MQNRIFTTRSRSLRQHNAPPTISEVSQAFDCRFAAISTPFRLIVGFGGKAAIRTRLVASKSTTRDPMAFPFPNRKSRYQIKLRDCFVLLLRIARKTRVELKIMTEKFICAKIHPKNETFTLKIACVLCSN